jgi:drug/metabolite transporter (DMT)-like permease
MKALVQWLTYGGMVIVCIGCLLPLLLGPQAIIFKIVYCVGAVCTLIGRILTKYHGKDMRVRRLVRIQVWSAIFFCAAGFLMWYSQDPRDWLAFTLAGALVQCYVSIVLPRAQKQAGEL